MTNSKYPDKGGFNSPVILSFGKVDKRINSARLIEPVDDNSSSSSGNNVPLFNINE